MLPVANAESRRRYDTHRNREPKASTTRNTRNPPKGQSSAWRSSIGTIYATSRRCGATHAHRRNCAQEAGERHGTRRTVGAPRSSIGRGRAAQGPLWEERSAPTPPPLSLVAPPPLPRMAPPCARVAMLLSARLCLRCGRIPECGEKRCPAGCGLLRPAAVVVTSEPSTLRHGKPRRQGSNSINIDQRGNGLHSTTPRGPLQRPATCGVGNLGQQTTL